MTDWKRDWSAEWNRSVNDGIYVGRNPQLTALLIMACRQLHSDALRNPDQAGLAYCNWEKRVDRATSHIACPARPQDRAPWLFLLRTLTLRPFPLQLVHASLNSIRGWIVHQECSYFQRLGNMADYLWACRVWNEQSFGVTWFGLIHFTSVSARWRLYGRSVTD